MRRLALALAWAPILAHAEPAPVADARAAGPRLSFQWSAPEGCPTHAAVLARTEQLLGRSAESSLSQPLAIDATVSRAEPGWELRLGSGAAGEPPRLVSAATCEELGEMAALFVALSIDPTLPLESVGAFADLSRAAGEESSPAPKAETAPSPEPPPIEPSSPPASRSKEQAESEQAGRDAGVSAAPNVRPLAGASAVLGLGRLPGAAFGVRAHGGVAIERFELRAGLEYFPERYASATPTTGGDLSLGTVGLHAAYALAAGALTFAPSGGVAFGWLHGAGDGVANPASGDAFLVGLEPGLRASYALSPSWALVTDAALHFALNRPGFVLDEIGEVYRPARVGARFGLGAEWSGP